MEIVLMILLGSLLCIWVALGQLRYRKLAGTGHWGHTAIVVVLTLLLILCEYPYRDLHGYYGKEDLLVIALHVLLVAGVIAHGWLAAKIRRQERDE